MSAVMTVMLSRWSSRRTNSSAVVPESTSSVPPSLTSSMALWAMACFAATLTLMRRSCVETVRRLWSDTAPPCVRRSLPASARASKSARAVTEDTPKVWAISATCTEALCSSISMMAARRSSAKARVAVWAMTAPFSAKFAGIVLTLFSFIFFLSKKTPFEYLSFL